MIVSFELLLLPISGLTGCLLFSFWFRGILGICLRLPSIGPRTLHRAFFHFIDKYIQSTQELAAQIRNMYLTCLAFHLALKLFLECFSILFCFSFFFFFWIC